MDEIEEAKAVYSHGKLLVSHAASAFDADSRLDWLVEDLEDALLDLKQSVLSGDLFWIRRYTAECRELVSRLDEML